jgi:hypothetical protein
VEKDLPQPSFRSLLIQMNSRHGCIALLQRKSALSTRNRMTENAPQVVDQHKDDKQDDHDHVNSRKGGVGGGGQRRI